MKRRSFLIASTAATLSAVSRLPFAELTGATGAAPTIWDGSPIDSVRGPVVVDRPGVVTFGPEGLIVAPVGRSGITVTSSGVTIRDARVEGPGSTITGQDTSRSAGISIGRSDGATVEDVRVEGGSVSGFPYTGILASGVRGLVLEGISITDIAYSGVQMLSVVGGSVRRCSVDGLHQQDYPNSYGILAARDTNQSLEAAPRCSDIEIVGNDVRNVPMWEGIDTHGGVRITVEANTVVDCATGIAFVPLKGVNGGPTDAAPLDARIAGNTVTWTGRYTDTSAMRAGINVVGAGSTVGSTAERATGVVEGNVVSGYGDGTSLTASILTYLTQGLVIADNEIRSGWTRGILLYHSNADATVTGNTVADLAARGAQSYRSAIDVRTAANDVLVDGNRAFDSVAPEAGRPRYGLSAPGSGSVLRLGRNDWGAAEIALVPTAQKNTVVTLTP